MVEMDLIRGSQTRLVDEHHKSLREFRTNSLCSGRTARIWIGCPKVRCEDVYFWEQSLGSHFAPWTDGCQRMQEGGRQMDCSQPRVHVPFPGATSAVCVPAADPSSGVRPGPQFMASGYCPIGSLTQLTMFRLHPVLAEKCWTPRPQGGPSVSCTL